MMRINCIFYAMLAGVMLVGCSDSEDTTPSLADVNVFEPAEDDNSETAQIRREFFNATGSYLLFNDTLRAVNRGTAADGSVISRPEMLDIMRYVMTGYGSSTHYTYEYINSPEGQRAAVQLVNDHLVWRMGRALPYAFFIVNDISYRDNKNVVVHESKLLGLRAYAISLSGGDAFNDPETYFRGMIADMVKAKIKTMSEEELAAFYDFSRDYYYEYKSDFGLSDKSAPAEEMWNYGFFVDVYGDIFPSSDYDLEAWLAKVTMVSRGQFEAQYGSSSVMMGKYEALVGIIEDLGYVLD